jgi:hypothetical protein
MERTLTLPRPLKDGAHAWLEVQVGPLAPGQRVRVTTLSGELLGAISPFGPTERRHSGLYSLPVPADAIRNGALSVRVTITDANKPARTPTDAEVQKPEIADSRRGAVGNTSSLRSGRVTAIPRRPVVHRRLPAGRASAAATIADRHAGTDPRLRHSRRRQTHARAAGSGFWPSPGQEISSSSYSRMGATS